MGGAGARWVCLAAASMAGCRAAPQGSAPTGADARALDGAEDAATAAGAAAAGAAAASGATAAGAVAAADATADAAGAADAAVDASAAAPSDARAADAAPGRVYAGEATWYATDGRGTCRFPPNPEDPNVVAINRPQYAKIGCGQCLLVTGPSGTVKVRVVDVCPGCAAGDLDLSAQAFGAIAAPELGRVHVRWFVTPC